MRYADRNRFLGSFHLPSEERRGRSSNISESDYPTFAVYRQVFGFCRFDSTSLRNDGKGSD